MSQVIGIAGNFEVVAFDSPGADAALNNLSSMGFSNQVANYDYTKITVRNVEGDWIGGYGDQLAGATVNVINVDDILSQTPNGRSGLLFVAMSDALQSDLPNNLFGMLLIAGIEVNEELTQRLLYHNMENHTYTLATDYAKATELQTSVKFLYAQDDSLRVDIYDKISVVETSGGESATFYLGSDNGLYGIIENPDGTSSFYYRYGNDENEFVSKTFNSLDDMSNLTVQEQYIAQEIVYQKYLAERKAAEDLLQNNPDIVNDPEYSDLPQGVKDQINDLLAKGQAVESEDALNGQVIEGDFGNDELGGGIGGDTLGIGAENFNANQLAWIIQNGAKEDQIGAALQLYSKIKFEGILNSATGTYTLGNATIQSVANSFGGTAVKISVDGIAQSYITKYDQGNFQQRVVETVGPDGRTNSAEITLADGLVNQLYRGEAITINYPDNFVFGYAGGYVGNLVGQQLVDGELAHDIIVSAITQTVGSNIGEVLDFLAAGQNSLSEAIFDPFFGVNGTANPRSAMLDDFLSNLQAGVASAIGGKITEELGDLIDIGGLGGDIFDVVGNTVTTGFVNAEFGMLFNTLDGANYATLIDSGFNFNTILEDTNGNIMVGTDGRFVTTGDYIQAQVFNAIAAYAGARLAGELISPESQQAAIFGSIGSALGTAVASGAILTSSGISAALTTTFATFGSFAPVVGTAIGAFIGTTLGTFIGNLFGGSQEIPEAWARGVYDGVDKEFQANVWWDDDGGDASIALGMLNQVMQGVNGILDLTQGKLRQGSHAPEIQIGYEGNIYRVAVANSEERSFSTAVDAINYASFRLMKGFDLVGGHAVLMRAWHNSDATNIFDFKEDLEVAEAFQLYLTNPTGRLAMMMDQPDSELALSWATILKRSAEL
ncbi:MAG: hypothetical protein KDJ52_31465, partial [Anaerolineae bacterium]|nr:hypothetical protein [Anaerolineae bacterium]